MVESVGKKLNQARLRRGLTIDEAAHATKLRPDKIAALESDDYTSFANNIYAKGFLQIYSRFLEVDVSEFSRTLDNANPISVSDYQYLSNAPAARRESTPIHREERKPPSLAPLFFFAFLIAAGLVVSWGYTKWAQITGDRMTRRAPVEDVTPAPAPPTLAPASAPVPTTPAPPREIATVPTIAQTLAAPTTPAPAATPAMRAGPSIPAIVAPTPLAAVQPSAPTPRMAVLQPTPAPNRGVQFVAATPGPLSTPPIAKTEPPRAGDQDFVTPTAVPVAESTAHPVPSGGINEVLVATVRKTWVTVRKDDPKARPIFADYVYPSAHPLKLKGARFFIEATDPSSVQITKNGLPFAYQAPNVPVQ